MENPDFLAANSQAMGADLQELQTPEGELYLRFHLPSGEEFALPAAGVREVMQQPLERVVPIPNASPLLLGTINLRGQIVWVADLGRFLGDAVGLQLNRAEIPVIAIENQETILGLAVERLGAMEWLDAEQLRMPTNVPNQIAPYVQGEWILDGGAEQGLRLLDREAILRSARWAT